MCFLYVQRSFFEKIVYGRIDDEEEIFGETSVVGRPSSRRGTMTTVTGTKLRRYRSPLHIRYIYEHMYHVSCCIICICGRTCMHS